MTPLRPAGLVASTFGLMLVTASAALGQSALQSPPPVLTPANPNLPTFALPLLPTSATGAPFSSSSPYLLGDWGGERTKLADEGITFNFAYGGGELAHNFTGGTAQKTAYADQWALGINIDSKVWGWSGGTLQILYTDRNGNLLDNIAHLGTDMQTQEVFGRGQTWLLTQFSYTQKLFDDKLEVAFGRLPAGNTFDSLSCDFQNLTFCGSAPGNLVGNIWYNWPVSSWAGYVKVNTSSNTYIQVGAYQVDPLFTQTQFEQTHGFEPDFPTGTTGWTIPVEFGVKPTINGLPGTYIIGAYDSTAPQPDLNVGGLHPATLNGLPALQIRNSYGGYVSFSQQVTGIPNGKGTTLFFNFTAADPATAIDEQQVAVGAEYRGPFNRPNDAIGFSIGATKNNPLFADFVARENVLNGTNTIAGRGYEVPTELFYSYAPIPSVQLRPDLQYVIHPGGTSQNANVFILGLKVNVTL
jgi:porin